jgi:hypothetical protein
MLLFIVWYPLSKDGVQGLAAHLGPPGNVLADGTSQARVLTVSLSHKHNWLLFGGLLVNFSVLHHVSVILNAFFYPWRFSWSYLNWGVIPFGISNIVWDLILYSGKMEMSCAPRIPRCMCIIASHARKTFMAGDGFLWPVRSLSSCFMCDEKAVAAFYAMVQGIRGVGGLNYYTRTSTHRTEWVDAPP